MRYSSSLLLYVLILSSCGNLKIQKVGSSADSVVVSTAVGVKKVIDSRIPSTISRLQFIGEYDLPHKMDYDGTVVGGLSGIDYDAANEQYYIVCDDRSQYSPSRFYTAKINVSSKGIDSVFFTNVTTLKQKDGQIFPSLKIKPESAADPESIRYNAADNTLIWSSEGDRAERNGKMIIVDPWVWEMNIMGQYKDSFHLPANLHMNVEEKGLRDNGVFEGLAFNEDYSILYVSVEEPLYEDGPRSDVDYAGAPIRIVAYDVKSRMPKAQYAYPLDPIANKAIPENAFKVNGVSEILYAGNKKLITMERSFSSGIEGCVIKLFLTDLSGATDVSGLSGLDKNKSYKMAEKKLLFNLSSLGRYIDNVEGITFGPKLPNGHSTLLLCTDDNFNKEEKTQLFLFEIF